MDAVTYAIWGLAVLTRLAFLVGLVLAASHIYRKSHLPSIPWLIAYLLLTLTANIFIPPYVACTIMSKGPTRGGTFMLGMTASEFYTFMAGVESFIHTVGYTLAAWFVVADCGFVLSRDSAKEIKLPQAVLAPRRHPVVMGIMILATGLVVPVIWLTIRFTIWVPYP